MNLIHLRSAMGRARFARAGTMGRRAGLAASMALALVSASALADNLVTEVAPHEPIPGASPVPVTAGAGLRTREDLETFLDGVMADQLRWQHFAGATVSVVKDGKLFFAKGYGYADVEHRVPVDAEKTLFRPGSTSKLFTWTALMQLVEQGKVGLDDDVNKYITQFQIPATFPEPVRIRNLLTHTEGFEDAGVGIEAKTPDQLLPLAESLKRHIPARVRPPTTDFNGGEVTSYSNWGAALAGLIVANVSGMDFDAYAEKNVFEPLGMDSTTFREPLPQVFVPRMSNGYAFEAGGFAKKDYELFHNIAPAGSAASTATDMAKFMIAHLNDGEYGGKRILKPETAQLMHRRSMGLEKHIAGSALGFYEVYVNGRRLIAHAGDTGYFHSCLWLLPEEKVGLFVSYNTLPSLPISMRDAVLQSFMDRYYPATLPVAKPPEDFGARAAKYTGTWRLIRHNYSTIEKALELASAVNITESDHKTLLMHAMFGDNTWQFYEVAPGVFRAYDSDEMMAFVGDKDGQAQYLLNPIGVPFIGAYRIGWRESPVVHYFVLGFALLCFLVALVGALRHWKADRAAPVAARRARRLAALLFPLYLAFVIGLLVVVSGLESDPSRWSPGIYGILTLPLLGVVLTLALAFHVVRAWGAGGWTRWQRAQYAVITLMAFAFLWSLNTWNLLGYKVG